MRQDKQNSPSLTGGAGSLNVVNLLGSFFRVNRLYTIYPRLRKSLFFGDVAKTLCITIGFCSLLLNVLGFWGSYA